MKKIFTLITKKEIFLYICSALCVILQVGLEVAIPQKMGEMTDMLQESDAAMGGIMRQGVSMFVYSLLALAAAFLTSFFVSKAGAALDRILRKNVFEKIISFSLEEMEKFGTSSLIARCTSDITQVQSFITGGLQLLVESLITIVWVIICISGADSLWTVSTVVAVLIIAVSFSVITIVTMPYVKRLQSVKDKLMEISREHIMGIRTVHAYTAFDFQRERYEGANEEHRALLLFYDKAMAIFNPGATAVLYILSVVIYVSGAYLITAAGPSEKMRLFSNMVEFISYSGMLISSFIYLIMIISNLPATLVSAGRIEEVLDTKLSITDGNRDITAAGDKNGEIEFSHVSFKYPGSKDYVLKDISFKVSKGENAALIGATGCGKTTLLNLIPRLYDASEGAVLVNGINVKEYKVDSLRNIIGYVPQKNFLFAGTIGGNIAYGENGRFKAALDDIKEAAYLGQAAEFISQKEGQYEAPVAQGGANFSGGQRQRLAISRAICRDPEIYLFDDSFSALDYKTDAVLRKNLRTRAGGATMLIVAQRISTVQGADKIIVLDKGKIVGEGTHAELMAGCRVYREIAQSQNIKEADS